MTTDELFARVQSEGFNGYAPGAADVMGDAWARKVGEVFDQVAAARQLPHGETRHKVYLVWQWLYCLLARCKSRVIASPPACRAAGLDIGEDVQALACEMLWDSQEF